MIRECKIRGQESTSWLVRFYLSLTSIDANIEVSQDFGRSRGAVLGKASGASVDRGAEEQCLSRHGSVVDGVSVN